MNQRIKQQKEGVERRGQRQWVGLVGLMLGSVFLACITAPVIFNAIQALREAIPAISDALDYPFERVASRLALIYVVIGFVPSLKWAGIRSAVDFGFAPHPTWWRELMRGWRMGVYSILALIVIAWATGAFVWDPASGRRLLSRLIAYLIGGLLIGVIEEGLFRGGLFGGARKVFHWIPAMIVISLFFSFVHFIRPQAPDVIETARWYSGFSILPHMLYRSENMWNYMPFALNLFLMGVVLTLLFQRQNHVYYISGMHAGWVIALQMGRLLFSNDPNRLYFVYGISANVGRSWAATLMLVIMAILAARGIFDKTL